MYSEDSNRIPCGTLTCPGSARLALRVQPTILRGKLGTERLSKEIDKKESEVK